MLRLRSEHDRPIARLAIPALGTLVAQPAYLLVDTAIIGHLGTPQLAGLALASTVLLTAHSLMIFLAYGTTGPVARLIATGRPAEAAARGLQGLWLAVAIGVMLALGLWGFNQPIFRWFTDDPDVIGYADTYLSISLIGFPFGLLMLATGGMFHGRQNTTTPLVLAVSGALIDLVLEVTLIFGFGYGIGAAAFATTVAQITTATIAVIISVRWIAAQGVSPRPVGRAMWQIFVSGQTLTLRTAALRACFATAAIVAARMGSASLAAHQIILQIWGVLALSLDAVAIAGQALTGKWLGTGDRLQARDATRRMIEINVMVGLIMGLIIVIGRHPIAAAFSTDPAVRTLVASLMILLAIQQPLNGHVFALDGVLIGAGDFRYLAASMIMSALIYIPLAIGVNQFDLGLRWLWATIGVLMASRAVMLHRRWVTDAWLDTPMR